MTDSYRDLLEGVLYKVDTEGLDYALQEGYLNSADFMPDDPLLAAKIASANLAVTALRLMLEDRREKYGIEVS